MSVRYTTAQFSGRVFAELGFSASQFSKASSTGSPSPSPVQKPSPLPTQIQSPSVTSSEAPVQNAGCSLLVSASSSNNGFTASTSALFSSAESIWTSASPCSLQTTAASSVPIRVPQNM